jgi:signal peptidase I
MTDTQRKGGNHLKHIKGQGETRVKSGPGRNVLKIVKNILVWLVVAAAVSMMIFTVISAVTFDRNDRDLFGFKAFIVRSDSMSATDFKAGDLILVKEVDPATLEKKKGEKMKIR